MVRERSQIVWVERSQTKLLGQQLIPSKTEWELLQPQFMRHELLPRNRVGRRHQQRVRAGGRRWLSPQLSSLLSFKLAQHSRSATHENAVIATVTKPLGPYMYYTGGLNPPSILRPSKLLLWSAVHVIAFCPIMDPIPSFEETRIWDSCYPQDFEMTAVPLQSTDFVFNPSVSAPNLL